MGRQKDYYNNHESGDSGLVTYNVKKDLDSGNMLKVDIEFVDLSIWQARKKEMN